MHSDLESSIKSKNKVFMFMDILTMSKCILITMLVDVANDYAVYSIL